jgi:hypothetical protein
MVFAQLQIFRKDAGNNPLSNNHEIRRGQDWPFAH